MNPIITVKDVRFKDLLHYESIEIEEGKVTFLCGDSGAGKSTLLKLLNATYPIESGQIIYKDRDINETNPVVLRREILLAAQTVFLFPGSIRENFRQFYEYREDPPLPEEEMKAYLQMCQVPFGLDENCDTMSGGERQRIFLAICLSMRPKVFMMDEPTSALDEMTGSRLMEQVKDYCGKSGITMIIVSHDGKLVEKFADHKIVIRRQR